MRQRLELGVGFGLLILLIAVAVALGRRQHREPAVDPRASTMNFGPEGTRAAADALERLGLTVRRYRKPPRLMGPDFDRQPTDAVVVIEPSISLDQSDAAALVGFHTARSSAELVLAGQRTEMVMACFGYEPHPIERDSLPVTFPGSLGAPAWTALTLVPRRPPAADDSSRDDRSDAVQCEPPDIERVDTLWTAAGQLVAARLHFTDQSRPVVLIADGDLLRNRTLRSTAAGPAVLALLAHDRTVVTFDEYHHGYGPSGSLSQAVLEWSVRSPWGRIVWQLVAVGLLALGFGIVRFGAPLTLPGSRRRSSLEHVRALATALEASHGHDVAIGLVINGLERRLGRPLSRTPAARTERLRQLVPYVKGMPARHALVSLLTLTQPGQTGEGVRRAARAVEALWKDLRP